MPTRAPSHSKVTWGRRVKDGAYQQQQKWRAEQAVYKSKRWGELRRSVLRGQPECADPYGWHAEDRRVVLAVQVDHIVPLRVDRGLAYVRGNLQGLCVRCHRVKTKEDLVRYPIAVDRMREVSTIRRSNGGIRGMGVRQEKERGMRAALYVGEPEPGPGEAPGDAPEEHEQDGAEDAQEDAGEAGAEGAGR